PPANRLAEPSTYRHMQFAYTISDLSQSIHSRGGRCVARGGRRLVLRAARFGRSFSAGVSAGRFASFVVEVAEVLECWDCGGQCGGLIGRQFVDEVRECFGAGLASVPE